MRGLAILGVLIIGLGWAGWVLRNTRQQISSVLYGFCGVLVVMLVAVFIFGVER